jgi:hypothetical protein
MTITYPSMNQLRVTLRQSAAEMAPFLIMTMLIVGVLAFSAPAPTSRKIAPALGILLLAVGWCAYALGCSELYEFNRDKNQYILTRLTPLRRSVITGSLQEIRQISAEMGGPDNDRRLIVLTEASGRRQALPRRINSLSETDQRELGRAVADFLGVNCRTT